MSSETKVLEKTENCLGGVSYSCKSLLWPAQQLRPPDYSLYQTNKIIPSYIRAILRTFHQDINPLSVLPVFFKVKSGQNAQITWRTGPYLY